MWESPSWDFPSAVWGVVGNAVHNNQPVLGSSRSGDLSEAYNIYIYIWVDRLRVTGRPHRASKEKKEVWRPLPYSPNDLFNKHICSLISHIFVKHLKSL